MGPSPAAGEPVALGGSPRLEPTRAPRLALAPSPRLTGPKRTPAGEDRAMGRRVCEEPGCGAVLYPGDEGGLCFTCSARRQAHKRAARRTILATGPAKPRATVAPRSPEPAPSAAPRGPKPAAVVPPPSPPPARDATPPRRPGRPPRRARHPHGAQAQGPRPAAALRGLGLRADGDRAQAERAVPLLRGEEARGRAARAAGRGAPGASRPADALRRARLRDAGEALGHGLLRLARGEPGAGAAASPAAHRVPAPGLRGADLAVVEVGAVPPPRPEGPLGRREDPREARSELQATSFPCRWRPMPKGHRPETRPPTESGSHGRRP